MKNKRIMISITVIVSLLLVTLGVSFSFFNYMRKGTQENFVTTGNITFIYEETDAKGKGINLEDVYPISDEEGKMLSDSNSVFNFRIKANTMKSQATPYVVTARQGSNTTLDSSVVKMYLTEVNEASETELLLDNYNNLANYSNSKDGVIDKVLYTDIVSEDTTNYEKNFRLRMWLDENTEFYDEMNDKKFSVTVNVYANGEIIKNSGLYYSVNSLVDSFLEDSLKEVIMCSYIDSTERIYYDCMIHNTIEDALTSKDKGVIILTSDISRQSPILIDNNKDFVLELNGKDIISDRGSVIVVNGNLDISNNSNEEAIITSPGTTLSSIENANLKISNVKVVSTNESNSSAICNNGNLIVNGDSYVEGIYGVGCHNSDSSSTIINDGTIIGRVNQGIQQNTGYTSKVIINDGYIKGNNIGISNMGLGTVIINDGTVIGDNGMALYNANTGKIDIYDGNISSINNKTIANNSSGVIDIYGGIIVSDNNRTIVNSSSGVININQKDRPLYITSKSITWQPVINNTSTGIININGSEADKCTNNSNDITSGLCIYAEGDKNYESDTSNTAVSNAGEEENGGIININGGTMFGGYTAISNHFYGTVNISGGNIQSGNFAISNMRQATTNICNAKISSEKYDIWAASTSTGKVNYSSNVIFTSGNNIPVIGGVTSNIIGNYTGTCTIE